LYGKAIPLLSDIAFAFLPDAKLDIWIIRLWCYVRAGG
jgi:hypothetical protein